MHPKRNALAALTAALIFTVGAGPAHAAQAPTERLADLAQHATHGWADDTEPLPTLERKLNAGQRVYITCGTISRLAVRRMQRIGVPARVVGSYTFDKPNGSDDGHIMVEAKIDGRWQVYDLDNNRKPVNSAGRGIGIAQFVSQKHRRSQVVATDKPADYRGHPDLKRRFGWVYESDANLERWYDHILGVPTVQTDQGWIAGTNDPVMQHRLRKLGYGITTPYHLTTL